MRKKLVAANWKMHGRLDTVFTLLEALVTRPADGVSVLVCPPFPYLMPSASVLTGSGVSLGAQNLAADVDGALTGEVSGEMLADCGVTHVLVGHSERRILFGETDAQVAKKFQRAQQAGLTPILCIGETQTQREAGTTEQVVSEQLNAVLQVVGVEAFEQAVIAYEPVWAIGTGLTASPQQAQAVHEIVRARIAALDKKCAERLLILYGGSVKADNAASLFAQPDIDGGLVGGASLDAGAFRAICQAAG